MLEMVVLTKVAEPVVVAVPMVDKMIQMILVQVVQVM